MTLKTIHADITAVKVDAIVNAANTRLAIGGGVCGAIFRAAGERELCKACAEIGPIKTGEAVITPGFGLPAQYIIHTAGPVYSPYKFREATKLLRLSYKNSLKIAVENGCLSVAFPLISSGFYGFPKDKALEIATSAIGDFLSEHELDVTLVLYDEGKSVCKNIVKYIMNNPKLCFVLSFVPASVFTLLLWLLLGEEKFNALGGILALIEVIVLLLLLLHASLVTAKTSYCDSDRKNEGTQNKHIRKTVKLGEICKKSSPKVFRIKLALEECDCPQYANTTDDSVYLKSCAILTEEKFPQSKHLACGNKQCCYCAQNDKCDIKCDGVEH